MALQGPKHLREKVAGGMQEPRLDPEEHWPSDKPTRRGWRAAAAQEMGSLREGRESAKGYREPSQERRSECPLDVALSNGAAGQPGRGRAQSEPGCGLRCTKWMRCGIRENRSPLLAGLTGRYFSLRGRGLS